MHDAEPDLPYQPIHVRWVLHLAGICPIVIELQLPQDDGDVVPLRVPVPDHPILETPTHGFEGIHMVVEYLEGRSGQRSSSVRRQGGRDGGSQPHGPTCSSPPRTSCFQLTDPSVLLVSVPRIVSQLCPVLVAKKSTEGQGETDWLIFPTKGRLANDNNLLTNCSGPPSRGRKFQVTVRASPTGAKLEKVHFNRTSVPLTASSTWDV